MPVRTMVVWCPDWPVVAAGIPLEARVAILQANRVIACSPAARTQGVEAGLRRREAQGRCPDLLIFERDQAHEIRAFEPVATEVEEFTPRIELTRPGTCAFTTRGPSRYFGGDEALARLLSSRVGEVLDGRGDVRVGAADGPFAAALAARTSVAAGEPEIVSPGESPVFLAPRPVTALDRPELTDVLIRLGLRTLGALAALPLGDLVGRFGAEGERAHRLASGLDERRPDTVTPPTDLRVTIELDPPVNRVDQVAFVAKSLADELHDHLGGSGLACTQVAVEAETEHGERRERLWRDEGALTASAMADRVRWQLDGWLNGPTRHRPSAGIIRLTLAPEEVLPATGRQLGFWGGETEAAERAGRALSRVEGLIGVGKVTVPEWRGGRGPVEAVGLVPVGAVDLTAQRPRERPGQADEPWPGRLPMPSPAAVHPEPVAVDVVDESEVRIRVDGRIRLSARPDRLRLDGRWEPITSWAGPWPIDERWWDPERHRRRARFQVITAAGVAHLLALEGGRWWLEATYD